MNEIAKNQQWDFLERPSVAALDEKLGVPTPVLDHGFVRLIDYMGDQSAITQAARVSYGKGTKSANDDRGLLRYLIRHHHTTPLEMCEIKLHVKLPIFVARQWIRHRTASVNEMSACYSILPGEFYIPEIEDMQTQSTTNKQGRGHTLSRAQAEHFQMMLETDAATSYEHYEEMVGSGIYEGDDNDNLARELARMNLPTNTYTEWYWKTNLHNLLNFLRLRADSHAQAEIRVYAEAIITMAKLWVPDVMEAWRDYVYDAHTFSRQEMTVVREVLQHAPIVEMLAKLEGCSKRETQAFLSAIRGVEE